MTHVDCDRERDGSPASGITQEASGAGPRISPEMAKAGARVLIDNCDTAPYWARSLAREVFAAMIKAMEPTNL
jgi:hypothetical protein